MKALTPLSAGAAALLLPSCIFYSHLGDCLRDPYTSYAGADIYHPVDGRIHYDPKKVHNGFPKEAYVIANEVTYISSSPVVNTDHFYPVSTKAGELTPTGKQIVAKISSSGYEKTLPALPQGLQSIPAPTTNEWRYTGQGALYEWAPEGKPNSSHISTPAAWEDTQPGWWRRRAINCCDYFVDPLLTFTYNTLFWGVAMPVGLAITPVVVPVNHICAQQQQQQDSEPQPTGPAR